MTRKNYLWALALPAMLAACTQDEFTAENANGGLKLVETPIENFSLQVNIGDAADTRVDLDENGSQQWEGGDHMGLAWYNPKYYWEGEEINQLNSPAYFANNMMTINGTSEGSLWTSDAVIMEGTHFAYFPFQTVWGDNDKYLQVKGGQERLRVYNAEQQYDDINARLKWMVNHQTMLSPSYDFKQDNGLAGITDSRKVDLYLFSNRLNITPKFVGDNLPEDLQVLGYELKSTNAEGDYSIFRPFAVTGEINANHMPSAEAFKQSNAWAAIDNCKTELESMYEAMKFVNTLSLDYVEGNVVKAADAPKFTFLLLPVNKYDYQRHANGPTPAIIQLVAFTNYGYIVVDKVEGLFKSGTNIPEVVTLSKLFFNSDNGENLQPANAYLGFVDNAGTTRGNTYGVNGDIVATFDFANIVYDLPCVKNNEDLDRAIDMIGNYKKALGDNYTEAEITICGEATFTDLDFTQTIKEAEEETGVDINVVGYGKWYDEDGVEHPYSEIIWKGESSIAQEIPNTNNFVEGTLNADVETENGLTSTWVQNGGKLNNEGTARNVTVEEGGMLNNNGLVKKVTNYGTTYNNPATTRGHENQPRISELYNYATVYNYAAIGSVEANNYANEGKANTAKIVLKNNPNIVEGKELGAIFNVENVAGDVMDVENNIEYTIEESNETKAGQQLAVALINKATNLFVADGTDIMATAGDALKGRKFAARITFNGNSTYTFASAAQFENYLQVGEVVLAEGAKVIFKNELAEGDVYSDVYGLVTDRLALNNGSKLEIDKYVGIVTREFYVEPHATVTVETDDLHSAIFYVYKTTVQAEIKGVNTMNEMSDEVKKYFGWN